MTTVLIVEDEPTPRKFLAKILSKKGYESIEAENLAIAHKVLDQDAADIVLLDIKLPDGNGITLLDRIAQESPSLPVIVATGYGDIDTVVDAMQNGAFDFITKPIDAERLIRSLENAGDQVKLYRELAQLRKERWSDQYWVQSSSKSMNSVNDLISRAAPTPASVLLTGETGTGKSLVAGLLHGQSPRSDKASVTINCAAISDHMLESELFGHEANAFTGAGPRRKLGLMEVADGSSLFLDEISTMKADLQAKLLRALEERVIRRVGKGLQVGAPGRFPLPALPRNLAPADQGDPAVGQRVVLTALGREEGGPGVGPEVLGVLGQLADEEDRGAFIQREGHE